ncbi:MAG: hypothetical protein JST14_16335 [Bacteroidetes bacterium]|nr:hypothetical protein [Bacteroidota bacterium]
MKLTIRVTGITILLALLHFSTEGQTLKLTPFGGYTLQDKVYGYYGDLIIRSGPHYGGMLSVQVSSTLKFDLTYSHQSTTYNVKDYSGEGRSGDYSGSASYIMIGTTHSPDLNARIAPFGGFMLGAGIFTPSRNLSEEWKFSVGGKLGMIYHFSDRVGLLLQTQLMIPVQSLGLGVGCGTSGCGGGGTTSSTATQLGFTGGVEIKLTNKE